MIALFSVVCACVGTVVAAAPSTGVSNMALMFDTASDYVSIPPFAFGGGPFTLEAWVRKSCPVRFDSLPCAPPLSLRHSD